MVGDVVVITGGSGGIGRAAAAHFAAEGARVVLVARDPERLRRAEWAIGENVWSIPADVATIEGAERIAAEVEEREGRLDVLINGAGRLVIGPASERDPEAAEALIRVNYLGLVRAVGACLPLLRRGDRRSIVNVSSIAARIAPPYMAAYAASKFAVDGYTRAIRQELRHEGFHVALVMPGPVDTPMIEGKIGTAYYPLPAGVPVVSPERVGRAIGRAVRRRRAEVVVPRRLSVAARLAGAVPSLVDLFYRRYLVRR